MKNDIQHNYNRWLWDEEMYLCLQWLVRDYDSPLSQSIEIIRSDFMDVVKVFYEAMMDNKNVTSHLSDGFNIHCYLMNKVGILQKRFIIFLMNIGNQHWVTSICCNPWYFLAKNMRKKPASELSDVIANMDKYVYGFLLYDPQRGF